MRSQYEAPINPAPPTLSIITGTTTNSVAGTYYVWLYCRNRAGITDFSQSKNISITTGQGIQITIPSAVKTNGSNIIAIGVVLSKTSIPASGCVVANVSGSAILPTTISLTNDTHFALNKHVATNTLLPNGINAINGMRRYVDDINKIVEYSSTLNSWINCLPQVFNPWVSSRLVEEVDGRRGCDRDLADITDYSTVIFPDYAADNSYSESVVYWIVNDGSTTVLQGQRIRMAIATDTFDAVSDDFKGLCELTFLGYVNTNTGVLDTSGMTIGGSFPYQGDAATNFVTQKDLLPGYAIALSVRMRFADYHLNNRVSQGEVVKLYPRLATNYSAYDPASRDLGDRIWLVGQMRRIIPDGKGLFLKALSGSASVARYSYELLGEQIVTGLALNTANQKIAISNTGVCYVSNATLPNETAALRAVVSTIDGAGQITAWSTNIALTATTLLQLSITQSTNIRGDYPDVIAGTQSLLNAGVVRVYVRKVNQTTIQYFDINTLGVSETIIVGSLVTGTLTELPTIASNFGLFSPPTIQTGNTISGASVFTADNYQYAIGYFYKDTVTSISHSTQLGCIREMRANVIDALYIRDSWGETCYPTAGQSIDDAIRNISEINTVDGQTRRVSGNPLIFFDSAFISDEVLTGTWSERVWKPTWRTSAQSGRWRGERSIKGEPGNTPDIDVTATTLLSTDPATAIVTGTSANPLITFGIPAGERGITPTISVAATTLASNQSATATLTGTTTNPLITFGIPTNAGSGAPASYGTILFDNQTTLGTTSPTQIALQNHNGALKLRLPNGGAAYQLATIETTAQNNILLNGGFQIAQATNSWTLAAGTTYSHLLDHWQGTAGASGAATITQNAQNGNTFYFLRWIQTTLATTTPILRTRLENATTLAGNVCTLSFNAIATANTTINANLIQSFGTGGTPSTAVITPTGTFVVTTTKQRFNFTVVLPSITSATFGTNNDSSLDLTFVLPTNSTFQIDFDSIKLEPGGITTPFLAKPLDMLLPSLYRYLYRLSGATGSLPYIGAGRAMSTNIATMPITFPSRMYKLPTLTGSDILVNALVATAINLSPNGASFNVASVDFTTTLTTGGTCLIKLNSANSFLQFDARMSLA